MARCPDEEGWGRGVPPGALHPTMGELPGVQLGELGDLRCEQATPEPRSKISAANLDIFFSARLGGPVPMATATVRAAGEGFPHRSMPGVGPEGREGSAAQHILSLRASVMTRPRVALHTYNKDLGVTLQSSSQDTPPTRVTWVSPTDDKMNEAVSLHTHLAPPWGG